MTTTGEQIWASMLKSMTGKSLFTVSTSRDILASVFFSAGKWVHNQTQETRVGDLKVVNMKFQVPYKIKPKVYLILRSAFFDSGMMYYKKRIPWPYTYAVSPQGKLHIIFQDKTVRVVPQTYLKKFRQAYARYHSKSNSKQSRLLGSYTRALTGKVSPIRSYTQNIGASEVYNAQLPGNSYPYRIDSLPPYESYYHSWTSVRTPGFRFKRRSELPVNPYTSVTVLTNNGQGCYLADGDVRAGCSSFVWYNHAWSDTTRLVDAFVPAAPVHSTVAYNKALAKLVSNSGLSIEANLAQDLAQFGQTTRLIANTAIRIAGSVSALKRGNFDSAVKYLWHGQSFRSRKARQHLSAHKGLAENWLELQYGWKPLLNDVHGSIQSLKSFIKNDRTVRLVRGSNRNTTTSTFNVTKSGAVVGHGEIVTISTTRFVLRYKVDDRLKSFAAQTGFTNPVNLAWEVIPFSFVVDWFLPIGPFLEMLSAFDGCSFQDGARTQFTKQRVSADVNFNQRNPMPNGCMLRMGGSYTREYILTDRIKLTAFPSPKIPTLKNPISVTHATNALALLMAVFGRKRTSMKHNFWF